MEFFEESIDQTGLATCPKCGSRHCQLQATARKTGMVVGGVLGAIASVISKRPSVTTIETIGGVIVGFVWGAIAGQIVGVDIDKNVLQLYQCHTCGFEF